MLRSLFSFDGRLDRRGYLLWSVTACCLAALPTMWTIMFAKTLLHRPELLEQARPIAPHMGLIGSAIGAGLTGLWLWTTSAVSAKRLRDMGLSPMPFLAAALVLPLLSKQLQALGGIAPLVALVTLVAALFALLFPAVLVFWPGCGRESDANIADTFA